MASRAIFAVDQVQGGMPTLRIEREVVATNDGDEQVAVDLESLVPVMTALASQPLAAGTVADLGEALLDLLLSHPSIPRQIDAVAGDDGSLLIEDLTAAAQSLPWEALKDRNGKFIALRDAPLLGRSVRRLLGGEPMARVFQPPLRVLAVLAAAGQQQDGSVLTAKKEAQAIVRGLSAVQGPEFELLVLGVDDEVEAILAAANDSRLRYRELRGLVELEEALREHKPHLLHFFCHGFADEDTPPRLDLALRSDQVAGFANGSLLLEADQIVDLIGMANPQSQLLMLSLNCCLGAAATETISLARDLMKNTDLPAVIAMREAIDRRDAHAFAETFFGEARRLIGDLLAGGLPDTLDWTRVLPAVRTRLCIDRCQRLSRAKDCKEWTLPVLYTRREPLRIGEVAHLEPGSAADDRLVEIEAKLTTLVNARAELSAIDGLPAAALAALDGKIADLVTLRQELAAASEPNRDSTPAGAPDPVPMVDEPAARPDEVAAAPVVGQPLATVRLNAWLGSAAASPETFGAQWSRWALRQPAGRPKPAMLGPTPPPQSETARFDWKNPEVGWGVVLPDIAGASQAELAAFDDAPPAIQRLIRAREAVLGRVPIFRARHAETLALSRVFLHDFRSGTSPAIDASETGVAVGRIPQYLLLAGSPEQIPWGLQYVLSTVRYVGRLDLDDEGLERYVDRLLADWAGSEAKLDRSLNWAVRHSAQDITATMRKVLTRPLHKLLADPQVQGAKARFIDGKSQLATAEALIASLAEHQPALIATSSHGQTWPLDDSATMGRDLGMLVDQSEELLDPEELLADWQPDGAVWIAHACCSAGAKAKSEFVGLFDPQSTNAKILSAVAALGERTSPLPRALLGAAKPARAFIGQVEPTFDWTLKQRRTKQRLTGKLLKPVRDRLLAGLPIGSYLERWHGRSASLNTAWIEMRGEVDSGRELEPDMLYPRLAAADVASTVLLGDPTAFLG